METKSKIIKMAKICQIVSKVLYCVACAVCLALIALAIALSETNAIKEFSKAETAIVFSTAALFAFICIGLLWNVEGIFKSVLKEQSPFGAEVSRYLKKISIFILVLSLVPALLGTILMQSICPDSELVFPISVGGIIAGVVMFIIGMFFKYGAELQLKDDETL